MIFVKSKHNILQNITIHFKKTIPQHAHCPSQCNLTWWSWSAELASILNSDTGTGRNPRWSPHASCCGVHTAKQTITERGDIVGGKRCKTGGERRGVRGRPPVWDGRREWMSGEETETVRDFEGLRMDEDVGRDAEMTTVATKSLEGRWRERGGREGGEGFN